MDKWRSALDAAKAKAGEAIEKTKEKASELKEKTIEKTAELKERYREGGDGEMGDSESTGAAVAVPSSPQRIPLQQQSKEQLLQTAIRISTRCKDARAQLAECRGELEDKTQEAEGLNEMVALLQAERRQPGGAAGVLDALRAEVRQERGSGWCRARGLSRRLTTTRRGKK